MSQEDLAELRYLEQELAAARRAFHAKRREIQRALEAGAAIEPGLRKAKIKNVLLFS